MFTAYQYFKNLYDNKLARLDFKDLCDRYKESKDDRIFATSFVMVYGLAKDATSKYYSIDQQDKVDLVVKKLETALLTYSPEKNVKFTNYFYTILNNSCQDFISKTNHTYDMTIGSESLDKLIESGIDVGKSDEYQLHDILNGKKLSEKEMKFCLVVMKEPHKLQVTEIANELRMSRPAVYSMVKRLREIFSEDFTLQSDLE